MVLGNQPDGSYVYPNGSVGHSLAITLREIELLLMVIDDDPTTDADEAEITMIRTKLAKKRQTVRKKLRNTVNA